MTNKNEVGVGNGRRIRTSSGKYALVDNEDYDWLSQYSWNSYQDGKNLKTWRAVTTKRSGGIQKTLYMSRMIMKPPKGKVVDHINHNGLDNRKSNLRVCTQTVNCINRRPTKCKYLGVSFKKSKNKWVAQIAGFNGGSRHIGVFNTQREAALAFNKEAIRVRGKDAYVNKLS